LKNRTRLTACAAIVLASLVFSLRASAELSVRPGLSVSEEYNDNIFLLPKDEETDYITRVVPSVGLQYKASLWDWDVAYAYDYRHYDRHGEADNNTHTATITNVTRLVDQFLFLEVQDKYDRVSLSLTRDYTQESIFVNQSDRNILQLNPFFLFHLSQSTTLKTGYTYRNIWFKDPTAVDQFNHEVSAEAKTEMSPRLTFTTSLSHTGNTNREEGYRRIDLVLGPRYEFAEDSYLWFAIGGARLAFEKTGTARQLTGDAGVTYKRSLHALSFKAGLNYVDDPLDTLRREERYEASLKSGNDRTSLELSVGLFTYRDTMDDRLEGRTYKSHGAVSHGFTRTWRGLCDLAVERIDDKQMSVLSYRYVTDLRIDYQAAENLTLSVDYRYLESRSPDVYQFSYNNNRIIAEVKQTF